MVNGILKKFPNLVRIRGKEGTIASRIIYKRGKQLQSVLTGNSWLHSSSVHPVALDVDLLKVTTIPEMMQMSMLLRLFMLRRYMIRFLLTQLRRPRQIQPILLLRLRQMQPLLLLRPRLLWPLLLLRLRQVTSRLLLVIQRLQLPLQHTHICTLTETPLEGPMTIQS